MTATPTRGTNPIRGHGARALAALIALSVLVDLATGTAATAATLNKCVVNGTVTYQQAPCPTNIVRQDPSLDELNATERQKRAAAASSPKAAPASPPSAAPAGTAGFRCDGRRYCSQMRSCDEAKYFLTHCPDTKMDGDHDGIPCEEQWCSR